MNLENIKLAVWALRGMYPSMDVQQIYTKKFIDRLYQSGQVTEQTYREALRYHGC